MFRLGDKLDLRNGVVLTYLGKDADGGDLWQLPKLVLDELAATKVDPEKHERGM